MCECCRKYTSNYFHALGGSSEIELSEGIKAYDYENFDGEGGDDIEEVVRGFLDMVQMALGSLMVLK